ncbi:hypothetical protein C4588_01030 [Candidatus Parcubacteria bacterium]|nr:MAG: hypothetical protein C4588_01030 [Candidatus Parcubacteria bacterium]
MATISRLTVLATIETWKDIANNGDKHEEQIELAFLARDRELIQSIESLRRMIQEKEDERLLLLKRTNAELQRLRERQRIAPAIVEKYETILAHLDTVVQFLRLSTKETKKEEEHGAKKQKQKHTRTRR